MKKFLDENFLLSNATAQKLYHEYAKNMPIIDYHNHLSPNEMAEDKSFENITKVWLNGDHYKWRAMRTNGVEEEYITGEKTDWEKFRAWAATVPYTLRNPLYHWTHLELQRYFDINTILNADTAKSIYDECNEKLQSKEYSVRGLLEKMNVKVVCTTDDPLDSLEHHQKISKNDWSVKVLPAFRPDKAMNVDDRTGFNNYLSGLEKAADVSISTYNDYLSALKKRHTYFVENNCNISDHGLEEIYAEDYTTTEIAGIFANIRSGGELTLLDNRKFKSAMLVNFAEWDWEKGFVQQYHLGALRNNNSRMLGKLGPDTGWDSIGDFSQARTLSKFLNRLDKNDTLAKTIIYNLNPADNELFATMIGNFNDGTAAGKVQWGSSWWFLDQKDGMTKQINALSNMGLLSRFIGMLTDSRSFLSFPRHEYFRRILCNLFGEEIENGELPNDIEWTGKVIQDICFNNAKNYFNWQLDKEAVGSNATVS
ncbi:MAG: glucuronate isomerase [Chitinophagaceae bacterium]|nr:glucuronate isomerase [Chitinophagaceae bacterium]MBK8607015.1 glucuronate isomerase [Chitinophagaceae bacterium]MBP6476989.1 glucuronate isomerase [Chitinophagaceae bacterium]MBP7107887.1 glucuronate isomerase [Chitinophagaceae bacterium]MBP7313951.1 glucuronate isomerase [Chitinophagaceae bacterium]